MSDPVPAEQPGAHVRRLLGHLLRAAPFPGRDELLRQVDTVQAITMLDLRVAGRPPVPVPDGPAALTAIVNDARGAPVGELLVWVSAGQLSGLAFTGRA